ncbi:MAG: NADH-quinone oxidoreductase subunit C [Acidobacteria bacterium]|nr:NADH-quinone oxidoreductase subunit C [Acidobacteriota bacterium]
MGDFINQHWGENLDDTIEKLKQCKPEISFKLHRFRGETTAVVKCEDLHRTLQFFKSDGFNYVVDVSSAHYPEREEIELSYIVRDLETKRQIRVKTSLPVENPRVLSACDIWAGANWMEREVYDLMGVIFEGHPDLRRILMPEDFEDFPLRKEYPMEGDDDYRNFLKPGEGE